jgi:hypothetical protein
MNSWPNSDIESFMFQAVSFRASLADQASR